MDDFNPQFDLTDIAQDIAKHGEHEADEVLSKYEPYRITEQTEIEIPVPVVTIAGETICTAGNITAISGAGKAGKSGITGVIIAGAISTSGEIDGLDQLEVLPNLNRHAVIHFDTEQAKHKHQINLKSIRRRANLNSLPDYFLSFNIRQLPIEEYKTITTDICKAAAAKFGGIHLLVIDGIADYITDVNDAEQANDIVKFFLDLSSAFNCPIITIVHTNPGMNSDKERGHLGSQIQRKCESLLNVQADADGSTLKPKFLRMAGLNDIPEIRFTWDKEKGYHVTGEARSTGSAGKNKSVNPELLPADTINQVINSVFRANPKLQYGKLRVSLKLAFQAIGHEYGDNKLGTFIQYLLNEDMIKKEGTKPINTFYSLNLPF